MSHFYFLTFFLTLLTFLFSDMTKIQTKTFFEENNNEVLFFFFVSRLI